MCGPEAWPGLEIEPRDGGEAAHGLWRGSHLPGLPRGVGTAEGAGFGQLPCAQIPQVGLLAQLLWEQVRPWLRCLPWLSAEPPAAHLFQLLTRPEIPALPPLRPVFLWILFLPPQTFQKGLLAQKRPPPACSICPSARSGQESHTDPAAPQSRARRARPSEGRRLDGCLHGTWPRSLLGAEEEAAQIQSPESQ